MALQPLLVAVAIAKLAALSSVACAWVLHACNWCMFDGVCLVPWQLILAELSPVLCCLTIPATTPQPVDRSWAIGMSHLRSTSHTLGDADFPYIYKKGPAFGMPGVRVDGMDVLKVCALHCCCGRRSLTCVLP
jgi:hypothetical protein